MTSSTTHQTRSPGQARVRWGTITREQIIATATDIVRAGGYDSMTIRSLADQLGVAPMSLYRHVRNKDDLLEGVVDRLLADAWRPTVPIEAWITWTMDAADRLRAFLVAQPAALHVYLRHPVVSPTALERMDTMLEVLRTALADEHRALDLYAAIHTYTVGFAALEAARSQGTQPGLEDDPPRAQLLASYTTPKQFVVGLHLLLRAVG